jgi:hypothetical protein
MLAVRNIISTLLLLSLSLSTQASVAVSQDGTSEMSSIALISVGVVGLIAARKHMKSNAM